MNAKSSYLRLSTHELNRKANKAWELLSSCRVCPRECGVNRVLDEKGGFCKTGIKPKIYSAHPHFGEESCLVGSHGSGTIFFSSCNLACVYCQNWEISQQRLGREVSFEELADMMMGLQKMGCHNINFVSPTIWVPHILKSLIMAVDKGLTIPLVYNTGGYDSVESLRLLDGIVDIYMPDIKYSSHENALKYSSAPYYWPTVKKAVKEMYEQVGDLVVDDRNLAVKGLVVRHLILPNDIAGSDRVLKFLADLSKNTYVNIMDQYRPDNEADEYPQINRRITISEFNEVTDAAKGLGLTRLDERKPGLYLLLNR